MLLEDRWEWGESAMPPRGTRRSRTGCAAAVTMPASDVVPQCQVDVRTLPVCDDWPHKSQTTPRRSYQYNKAIFLKKPKIVQTYYA